MSKPQTIGARLRALRAARDWTRREACAEMGVTERTLSRWESDVTQPGAEHVVMLARVFGVSADRILEPGRQAA